VGEGCALENNLVCEGDPVARKFGEGDVVIRPNNLFPPRT